MGTTIGNADFLASQMKIRRDMFIQTATLRQLVDMLVKRSISI